MSEVNLANAFWLEPRLVPDFWIVLLPGGGEPQNYPVTVLDINGASIGSANGKSQYMEIWNASSTNTDARGFLIGEFYPFVFRPSKKRPPVVVTPNAGIFSRQFSRQFA